MLNFIKTFAADEDGAVTVDWVVLTAAVVGLGIVVVTTVRGGANSMATNISSSLSGATVATLGTLGSGS
ncbi:Flp pilus assembly protein, pilin Flp [Rubellimicrobium mesophilum DSM 19309]|uniref:Flp pilus assembly protein, pilin Flp n=1 Tax=Rubellimicrobium mesophilum DSM 19309 TaxID=442562 RepID=A0A017HTK9_9RHOB|nr:hypothetical protein [Rubellimicrobium mesophilum]EYD77847.1 Flp pilus assembly protein, pilin Flp [Rubellimicrobium mesophilum DSM 19309]